MLKRNQAVTVTGSCSNGWYRIQYDGHTADVSRRVSFERSGRLGFRLQLDRRNSQRQRGSDRYPNFAMSFVGYSYVWGGTSPSTGFDCSGLMYYVLTQYGYSMKRVANDQMRRKAQLSREIASRSATSSFSGHGATRRRRHVHRQRASVQLHAVHGRWSTTR
ncbi:MAG: NlpC/P60 family protein [Oscillospiraceae bacterium]